MTHSFHIFIMKIGHLLIFSLIPNNNKKRIKNRPENVLFLMAFWHTTIVKMPFPFIRKSFSP